VDPHRLEPSSPLSPVGETGRIDSIDVLRGVALLGIFVMNIPTFALSQYAYFSPELHGGFEGADYWTWLLSHIFFEQKMMSIFSMLFGAGVVLFADRAIRRRGTAAGVHYRRMGWLLLIGMLHAYLIWHGDILVAYALVGMLVYPLFRLRPVFLLIIAAALLPISTILGVLFQWGAVYMQTEAEAGTEWAVREWQEMSAGFYPDDQAMAPIVVEMQTFMLFFWGIWRIASMMLLGMALYKWGVFSAARSTRFYAIMIGAGLLTGVPLVLGGVSMMHSTDFDPIKFMGVNGAFNYFGSVGIALAWVGAIMLMCKSGVLSWLRAGLAAVGRMAFTNYLSQSLIAAFIFYGWGLGHFGSMSRSELLLIVLAVWVFQILFSTLWLSRFRMGPLEWLWRSLTYLRAQPILRRETTLNPEAGTGR